MEKFLELLTNQYLITAISSWAIAQVLKVFIHAWVQKRLDWTRLIGDGGMPSGHSATVTSLAVFTALSCGPASFECAVSVLLAVIVCHDARGVRQETGKHAMIINEVIALIAENMGDGLSDVKLKELVGHTPLQVFAGILLGIVNACFMYFVVFG